MGNEADPKSDPLWNPERPEVILFRVVPIPAGLRLLLSAT